MVDPKTRILADERYGPWRGEIEDLYVAENRVAETEKSAVSPCGKYSLETCQYTTGPNTWNVSRGLVRLASGELIADVKRNYGHFWHAWVEHPNGRDYLLCGEDYQGYTVVDLTTAESIVYFPDAGFDGVGFCWTAVYPSPDRLVLAVDGCFWACPYEVVLFDFRKPAQLPLREMARMDNLTDCEGWSDNDTFVFSREVEFRKSDGAAYESLPSEEQDRLDADPELTDYRNERVELKRPPFAD